MSPHKLCTAATDSPVCPPVYRDFFTSLPLLTQNKTAKVVLQNFNLAAAPELKLNFSP